MRSSPKPRSDNVLAKFYTGFTWSEAAANWRGGGGQTRRTISVVGFIQHQGQTVRRPEYQPVDGFAQRQFSKTASRKWVNHVVSGAWVEIRSSPIADMPVDHASGRSVPILLQKSLAFSVSSDSVALARIDHFCNKICQERRFGVAAIQTALSADRP
jgi:hypothetical protein